MKKTSTAKDHNDRKTLEIRSLKKTIGIATMVASLGASLGVNVGDLFAGEKSIINSSPAVTSDVVSDQYKIPDANQHKVANQLKNIPANQHKVANQHKNIPANQHKLQNQQKTPLGN
ncbi:MAG: hypothetical protein KQI78_20850 [Deltaproteobacteria bacterium]|jgi:hypothetical protein|nr:hypothetical protein [Deltaproteobacteria bacterium]